ncbi:hypothetical protein HYALB_00008175 [Hymenoscyphus albidus]|uniref:Uncharacterized protein n=1 Tax=Hymenoscyphus albidus TaxID=595503 RepID=A0A9N9M018_9HELO|nr:hypothetical protein HYALB_00008175 [Hymenoscyphus albidus]
MIHLSDLSVLQLSGFGAGAYFLYLFCRAIYRIYFHPLAKYPGPRTANFSEFWHAKHWLGGRWAHDIQDAHRKYGKFVRIAPNELSVLSAVGAKEIYGHVNKDKKPFLKSAFYDGTGAPNLVTERDPVRHASTRRALAAAFSVKSLRDQTGIVVKYVDQFVEQLERLGNTPEGVPMEEWYNWLTFDIIGDLTFGEPFGAIEAAKTPPWIRSLQGLIYMTAYMDTMVRFPLVQKVLPLFTSRLREVKQLSVDHFESTHAKVQRRLQQENNRDDFFSHFLRAKHRNIATEFLDQQSVILITAGSDTTSTTLASLTYYLCKNPHILARLQADVRAAFETSAEIDGVNTTKIPYLVAVIEEALRIWTSVPGGLPRESPGAMVDGEFIPKGTIIHAPPFALLRSEHYWHKGDSYCPQRWLPKDDPEYDVAFDNDNHDAFKPFSQGSRACIGINLAYMEVRITLAKLVWHFDWELIRKDLDWEKECRVQIVWQKPEFRVRMVPRAS